MKVFFPHVPCQKMVFEEGVVELRPCCCSTNPPGGGQQPLSLIIEALIITRRCREIATCCPTHMEPLSRQRVTLGVGSAPRQASQSALHRVGPPISLRQGDQSSSRVPPFDVDADEYKGVLSGRGYYLAIPGTFLFLGLPNKHDGFCPCATLHCS